MKVGLSSRFFLITIAIFASSCHGPAGYGRIEYHPDQDNAVLYNTSTDQKITFVIKECWNSNGKLDTFKNESTVGPQENEIIGPMVDGAGEKCKYEILSAYIANSQ